MSPPPVRVEMNASLRPSGEYSGRDSFDGCDTSSRATPPAVGTVQMSPPDANAISLWSGEIPGSAKVGTAAGAPLWAAAATGTAMAHASAEPSRRVQRDIGLLRS